jgi:hypothetical protein
MLESVIQSKFIKTVKDKKAGLAVKVDSSSRRGWPDVIWIDSGGRTVYIEFKQTKGRLSCHQKETHDELTALGADVYVVSGEEGLNNFLKKRGLI